MTRNPEPASTPISAGGWKYNPDDPQDVRDFASFSAAELADAAREQNLDFSDHPSYEPPERYTTLQDAIEQGVVPALGEHGTDYDTEAITREAYAWKIDTDAQGRELLSTGGFELVVSDEEFWAIVEKHDRTTA